MRIGEREILHHMARIDPTNVEQSGHTNVTEISPSFQTVFMGEAAFSRLATLDPGNLPSQGADAPII